eukprot:405372_1
MIADRLAKKATDWCNIDTATLYCPVSRKTAKKLIAKQLDVEKELDLDQYQTSILLKLRSSHNELNRCKHILKHYNLYQNVNCIQDGITTYINCQYNCCTTNNSGKCIQCDTIEDEYHFLFICPKYITMRNNLWHQIEYMYQLHQIKIELHTLLFPPLSMEWKHRKMILSNLCKYVLTTKRFYYKIDIPLQYEHN